MTISWEEKIEKMNNLCMEHLDVPYTSVNTKGHYILVKLAPTERQLPLVKTQFSLFIPDNEKINQIYCGLVLAMGRYTFKDGVATKWTEGPLCELGDYVTFFSAESILTRINNYNCALIRDSNILFTTDNPLIFGNYGVGRFGSSKANKVIVRRKNMEDLGLSCADPNVQFVEDFEGK